MKNLFFAAVAVLLSTSTALADGSDYLQSGFKSQYEAGFSIGVGNYADNRPDVSVIVGYQAMPYLFVGAGVTGNYMIDNEKWAMPVYGDIKGTLPLERFAPFIDFRCGYTPYDISGLYMSPSIGCRYAVSEKFGVNFSVGYTMQKAETETTWIYRKKRVTTTSTESWGAVTLRIGFDF